MITAIFIALYLLIGGIIAGYKNGGYGSNKPLLTILFWIIGL